MKGLIAILIVLMASFALSFTAPAIQQAQFEKALALEEAQGRLEEAIALYQKIVDESNDQALAAQAQLRIGICHQKLGHKEAQNAFQKVIDHYPQQAETVKLAQEQLALLLKAQAVVEKKDSEMKIRRVWDGPWKDALGPWPDTTGAPSPDGRYLSFVDWETGDLAVLDLAKGIHRRLTHKESWEKSRAFAESSVWSPDSKLVAYSWYTDPDDRAEVRIIGIDGGSPRILCSEQGWYDTPVSWSPDGTRIAIFRRSKKGDWIAQADPTDGSLRILKSLEPYASYPSYWVRASYSPDSRYLAYDFPATANGGKYDISLLATDGSKEIPIVKHAANDRLLGWIEKTSEILFSSDRFGTEDAWAVRVAGGKPQNPPELIKRLLGEIHPMGFTRQGTFFFGICTRQFTIQIAAYDPEKPSLQISTEKTLLGSNKYGDWSPDGEAIAYLKEEDEQGVYRASYIRNLRTGEEHVFTLGLRVGLPQWSADGRSIVVFGRAESSNPQEADFKRGIYRIDVKTGRADRLMSFSESVPIWWQKRLSWLRVGESIVYADRDCLRIHELKSGQNREFYCQSNIKQFYAVQPSPDGRNIEYCTLEDGNITTIWVMPVAGGEASKLITFEGVDESKKTIAGIDWTPDGKYLIYAKSENTGIGFYQISAAGGIPQKLYHSKDQGVAKISVHPGGRQIALPTFVQKDEVWAIENIR